MYCNKKGVNVSKNTHLLLLMKSMYCNHFLNNNDQCNHRVFLGELEIPLSTINLICSLNLMKNRSFFSE